MSYLGTKPSNQTPTYKQVYEYTATAGQTTFTASYTVGFVSVFRNGVQLNSADYTATNGTSVVLANAASSGDAIRIESVFTANVQGAIPNTANAVVDSNINSMTASKLSGQVPAANAPSGSVLQVVQGTSTSPFSTNSGTFSDIGLSATITPKFATSKILISVCVTQLNTNGSNQNGGGLQLVYNSTAIVQIDAGIAYTTATTVDNYVGGTSIDYLHSPATTSACTYKVQGRLVYSNLGNFRIMPATAATSTITLWEIAA